MRIGIVFAANGRDENQDAVQVAEYKNGDLNVVVRDEIGTADGYLEIAWSAIAVICDGMGGLSLAKEAAQLAADTFMQLSISAWKKWAMLDPEDYVSIRQDCNDILTYVNSKIIALGQARHLSVGTTLCACILLPNGYLITQWIGDSRAYLYSADSRTMHMLTTDDNLATKQYLEGLLDEEQMLSSKNRNQLTAYLGELHPFPFHFNIRNTHPGDVVLLVSDGAVGSLDKYCLLDNLILFHNDLHKLADEICIDAREKGSTDNQSVICFYVQSSKNIAEILETKHGDDCE